MSNTGIKQTFFIYIILITQELNFFVSKILTQIQFFKRNLSFLNNFWNKENEWINYDSDAVTDMQEVIFELINHKELSKALQLLNKLEERDQNENELGFHYYLKGLITNEKEAFFKSVEYFKASQDKLSIKMPLIQLEKMGENPRLLKIITM
ncbi:hypothetical protein P5640_07700 [Bacillus subtilis]|nr:hypothetical protein P5640_07700 [Bacillus subtilis]